MNNNMVELEHMSILSFNNWVKNNINNNTKIIHDMRADVNNAGIHKYKRIRVEYNPNTIYLLDNKKNDNQYVDYIAFRDVEYILKINSITDNIIKLMVKCKDNPKEHIVLLA